MEAQFRDYFFDEAEFLTDLTWNFIQEFESWGARRVIPSSLIPYDEAFDPPTAFTVSDPLGGRALALRQDPTEQIRRLLSKLDPFLLPLRLYYLEEIWRRDPHHKDRPGERLVTGIEWIGAESSECSLEIFQLVERILAPIFKETGLTPLTLVLGSVDLYKSWFSVLRSRDPSRAFVAIQRKDLTLWSEAGDPEFPLLPWDLFTPHDPIPESFPDPVGRPLEQLKSFARALPPFFQVVIDPILPPPSPYYTGLFFALSSGGLPYEPWLRGGSYRVDLREKTVGLGFTLDLDPFIEGYRQGIFQKARRRSYLWMMGDRPPPPLPKVRWFRLDPAITDPWRWAEAHGLDGLVFEEEGRMKIYSPHSRSCEGDLGPCPM